MFLAGQFNEPFTVDGFTGVSFMGLIETSSYGNTIETGGFLPEGNGILVVPIREFSKVNLTPFPGMRVTVRGRAFVATTIENRFNQWGLRLEQAHPKTSDVPCFNTVIGTSQGPPVQFEAGQIQISKTP